MWIESERVFSEVKKTISNQRDKLKNETIELLKCLKLWFRLNLFIKKDLHAIIDSIKKLKEKGFEIIMN